MPRLLPSTVLLRSAPSLYISQAQETPLRLGVREIRVNRSATTVIP
jgi:hypothetical protein